MNNNLEVRQTRIIDASPEEVWEAWTQPELMMRWFSPMGMTTAEAEADVRVGGRYRVAMKQGETRLPTPLEFGEVLIAEGVYEKVRRPNLLVFRWSWVGWQEISRVRIELTARGEQTELKLTHTLLTTTNSRSFHHIGWESTLDHLDEFLSTTIDRQ